MTRRFPLRPTQRLAASSGLNEDHSALDAGAPGAGGGGGASPTAVRPRAPSLWKVALSRGSPMLRRKSRTSNKVNLDMLIRRCCPLLLLLALLSCRTDSPNSKSVTLAELQRRAARFDSVITLPVLETSPAQVKSATERIIADGNRALDRIGKLDPAQVSFTNTILALDNAAYELNLVANRLNLIKETSTNAPLREAATEQVKRLQDWSVGLDYREDVYASIKAFAQTKPQLTGEAKKAFDDTLRDYRRAGLELPKAQRNEVEKLRKLLASKCTDFQTHITETKQPVRFKKAELAGVPGEFLSQTGIRTGEDEYTLQAGITLQYLMVMENAKLEATRKKMLSFREQMAAAKNVPLMNEIVTLRQKIAAQLGYKSWADYQIEPKMAKDAGTAFEFLRKLERGLQPKFDAEVQSYAAVKARETGDKKATIHLWDWRYYSNQLKKEKYTVDTEALRVFFPYQKALGGMFEIYQKIFGIRINEMTAPYKWIGDLQLYAVSDATTGEPLGAFYLDMFPREGKYNHFAQFPIIDGKRLPNGKYQRPVAALICNFPPPQPGKPSLLTHDEVETLFHEFGHAMHTILTRAELGRFSGTSVPGDFVEAPSQMLESWIWDKTVLDSFAADYRDPSRKIPTEIIKQLRAAKLATIATHYRRQLSFALLDMALHGPGKRGEAVDCVKITNPVLSDVFFPVVPGTSFVASFGHLAGGYDAGYYGYAWADAIAQDMATVFKSSPEGFLDANAGRRLRDEVYAPGGSRDVNESIEKFLGRPRSITPFLRELGIGQ